MKSLSITIFLLFFLQISWAQYTEVINSNRPGFSNSPYSVGTKVYQVEGGIFYNNVGNFQFYDPNSNQTFAYSAKGIGTDISFRTGQFLEKLEFILDLAVQNESRDFSKPQEFSNSGFGLSKLTLGAKYLVYKPEYTDKSKEIHSWKARTSFDKKRLIPAVGVYAGFNTNLLQEMFKNPDGISPRFAIFTQNDLSNRLVVLTNIIMDKLFTNSAENSYIITVTYALAEKWSVFGENQGFFRKSVPNDFQFGAGGAYLINNNIQADFSVRFIFDERNDSSYLIGGGLSWRLDKHKDKIIQTETNNNEPLLEEKKGFFKGLFSGGLFKKNKDNSTKMRSVKTSKVKTRSIEPPVNKKAQKAKKKQNKRLIKEQKAKDKSQKKYNKKAKDKN